MENVHRNLVKGIRLSIKESDISDDTSLSFLDDYLADDNSNAKSLFINIENEKHGRVISMASTAKINLSKDFLLELDDLGINYEVLTNND